LRRVDFLVVQDIAPSATAGKAHVVLPAAALPEKEGTITNVEGRTQPIERVVQPPGEARTDLAILVDLAGRLDLREPSREFLARPAGRMPAVGALLAAAGAPAPGARTGRAALRPSTAVGRWPRASHGAPAHRRRHDARGFGAPSRRRRARNDRARAEGRRGPRDRRRRARDRGHALWARPCPGADR